LDEDLELQFVDRDCPPNFPASSIEAVPGAMTYLYLFIYFYIYLYIYVIYMRYI
jgi:hypothetical protein